MECPLCGNSFSEAVIQHHAWNCDGSRFEEGLLTQHGAASVASENYQLATCTSYFHQHLDGVGSVVYSNITAVPHCSTGTSRFVCSTFPSHHESSNFQKRSEIPLNLPDFQIQVARKHRGFCIEQAIQLHFPNTSVKWFTLLLVGFSLLPICFTLLCGDLEYFQKTTAVKTQECPLCGQSFPTNEIIEHAAFCNGPGFSRVLEQEIPNYSKAPEREGASDTMELFWSYVNGKEHAVPRAAVGAEEAKRVLSSKEVEEDSVLDLEKVLQYLKKMEDAISQDPEFKQVFGPLLKSSKPLSLLQSLSNTIFNQKVATGARKAAPVFLFFQLAKLFLPAILESEAFAVFKKWVEVFILETVVPWISQMGGWGPILCAFATLLASGLIVGLKVLLMSPTK